MKVLAKIFALSFAVLVFSTLIIQAQESTSVSKNTATPDSESKPITKKYIQTSKSGRIFTGKISNSRVFGSSKSVVTTTPGRIMNVAPIRIINHNNSAHNVTVKKHSQEQATDKPTSVTETK